MTPIYIFDLDGTLADAEHRVHHIQGDKKDWRAFYGACSGDAPIDTVIGLFKTLQQAGNECWIWTGRSREVWAETRAWLRTHDVHPSLLTMRDEGDYTADTKLKRAWLDQLNPEDRQRIVAVFEDRASVVQMWRDAGVPCFQVAPGDF